MAKRKYPAVAIHDAMSQNYQGIVWDRLVKKPQQPQQSSGIQGKYGMMSRWANEES